MMNGATKAWHGQSTKIGKKTILCEFQADDFERPSGDSTFQTIGVTKVWHGQSTKHSKNVILYKVGVTAAPTQ